MRVETAVVERALVVLRENRAGGPALLWRVDAWAIPRMCNSAHVQLAQPIVRHLSTVIHLLMPRDACFVRAGVCFVYVIPGFFFIYLSKPLLKILCS